MDWIHQQGDRYVVTGVDTRGRRFTPIHTDNPVHADGINLYRGSLWGVRNGKRTLIRRVWN
jgi:hypothetical protein